MNLSFSTIFVIILFCVIPPGLGLIVALIIRGKPLSMRGIQSAIKMDGATFLKTNEGDIMIKRRTLFTWLLIVFFGAIEIVLVGWLISFVFSTVPSFMKGKVNIGDFGEFGVILTPCLIIAFVLLQNIRTLRQPSIIRFNAKSRILEIGHGISNQQVLFSQITNVIGGLRPTPVKLIKRMDIGILLDTAKVIYLGCVTGEDAFARATDIGRQIAVVTGATFGNPPKPQN